MKSLNLFSTRLKLTLGALLCLCALLPLTFGAIRQAVARAVTALKAPQPAVVAHHAAPTAAALPQAGGGFTLPQTVTAGGGGESSGGAFQLQSTSGQSLTDVSSGGQFSLASGFWPGAAPCPNFSFAPATLPNPTAGQPYSQSIAASGGGAPYTFSATGLPLGLTLSAGGVLSGAPMQAGVFSVAVNAMDNNGCQGSGTTYSLTVNCPTAATLPATLPNSTGGAAYSASVAAAPGGTYTYAVTVGALPNGLSLNINNGAITGAPALTGTFTFTITATRFGSCSASQAYTVTISCPAVVDVLPKPTGPSPTAAFALPAATAGASYTTTIAATPAGGNYNFTLIPSPNNLPGGLSLNAATGVIAGLTTATGNYVFRIQATGFGACSGSRLYSLRVNAAPSLASKANQVDFDGDGKSDLWSYRAADGRWLIQRSSAALWQVARLGSWSETAVPADYDGDGKTDVAVYRAAESRWQILQSSDGVRRDERFGPTDGQAQAADYDGDGQADLAVRTAQGEWQIRRSTDGESTTFTLGGAEEQAVVADFDGDGLADAAVYRPQDGRWLLRYSGNGKEQEVTPAFAQPASDQEAAMRALAADFDGDGQAEMALWSAAAAALVFQRTTDQQIQRLAVPGAALLLGDYDGDGQMDLALWQAREGRWQMRIGARAWEAP